MFTAHYSFHWAEDVVKKVWDSYPRATEVVCKIYGLTDRNLVAFLASGDAAWNWIRTDIHKVEYLRKMWGTVDTTIQVISELYRVHEHLQHKRMLDRLDKRIKELKLEEQ